MASPTALTPWLSSIPQYSQASNIIDSINTLARAINTNVVGPLNSVIYPTIPAAAVNLLGVTVGATGSPVLLTVDGPQADTNADIIVSGRGTGVVGLGGTTKATASLQVTTLASCAVSLIATGATSGGNPFLDTTSGSMLLKTAGTTRLTLGSAQALFSSQIRGNNVQVTGSPAINVANSIFLAGGGSTNRLWSTGADTSTKGTFSIFLSNSDNSGNIQALAFAATGVATFGAGVTLPGGAQFLTTNTSLTDGAGVGLGTLGTAPAAGNPTKWVGINDNGTVRYIPAW